MRLKAHALAAAFAALSIVGAQAQTAPAPAGLYGQVGKMTVKPGQRDVLIAILLAGTSGMPGCLSYVVAKDAKDPDSIWITELWDSQRSHDASLSLPAVQDAIRKGRPLIVKMEGGATIPVGGQGLTTP